MKNNYHKKVTREDKFARKYYCQRARLNSIRTDKKFNKRIRKNTYSNIKLTYIVRS